MPRLLCLFAVLLISLPLCAQEVLYVVPDIYSGDAATKDDPPFAAVLVEQAVVAAEAGRSSQALQLATQALANDPNNAVARHVLGYEKHGRRWLTPFQAKQIERGYTWHASYGWVKQEDLPRYQQGERKNGRRWVSTEADAQRHASIKQGWRVRTDHFQVTTNHSLEAGAQLAAELEQLFQVWRQLFAGYYLGESEVQARFEGTRSGRSRSRPFNVIYHRSKEEYIAALRHKQPRIAETLGIYFDDLRQAHFFADEQQERKAEGEERGAGGSDSSFRSLFSPLARATLYHEAVHQLFQESRRAKRDVGRDHGFWLVEGVACYFEALTPGDTPGQLVIGAPNAGRLAAARHRRLADDYYVPLDELASLGKLDLQRREDLAPLYSQSAGLATYLMHGEQGRLREPLVAHLRALYEGKARPDDLLQRTGKTAEELDAGYLRFLSRLAAKGEGR